jgi:hypothetical protein
MEIPDLLRQRKLTRAVADVLTAEIEGHLQTLTPLINPRRVFAEHIHGGPKTASKSGPKALADLQARYADVYNTKPFDLRREFDTPLMLLDARPEIRPLSYPYEARTDAESKAVMVSTPLQWVLNYRGFGLPRLRDLLRGASAQGGPTTQQAVLHYLMLAVTLEMQPGFLALLEALRFPLRVQTLEEFGNLPIAVISGPLPTQRPADQVIIDSTEVSGSNDFEEILAPNALNEPLADRLRDKLQAVSTS